MGTSKKAFGMYVFRTAVLVMLATAFTSVDTRPATASDNAHSTVSTPDSIIKAKTKTTCQVKVPTRARWCNKVEVVGHRCVSNDNENTLYNFERVGRKGITCEADTRRLRVFVWVIHHDETIGRVVNPDSVPAGVSANARVDDLTVDQWRQLRTRHAVNPQPLAMLYAWIKKAGRKGYHTMIEVKGGVPTDQLDLVEAWVNKFDPNHKFVSFWQQPAPLSDGSCNLANIRRFAERGIPTGIKDPDARRCRLPSMSTLANDGFSFIHGVSRGETLAGVITSAHAAGIKIGVSFAANEDEWIRLVKLRVDKIMMNRPFKLNRWFNKKVR